MKPLLEALRGETPWPPPVWLMRQAGRYLPEYRALRARADSFISFCLTPELAIEATLQPLRRFPLDAAILFADILLVPHALGQEVTFIANEGPKLAPVRDMAALANLSDASFVETLAPVMATIRGARALLPESVALIGFAGAPWTVATYMIEGAGGSDFEVTRSLAWREPTFFEALLDRITDATSAYLISQADAGAEVLQLFDSWAGAVPASVFETAVITPTARIVHAVRARHPKIPVIGFPRGGGSHLRAYAERTGVDGVGVDHMTGLADALAALPRPLALQGNLDPVLLRDGGPAMTAEIGNVLASMRGHPLIFNLGHGVLPTTPPEHVAELLKIVRAIPE
ncbi:MAG TPA: uroporphyrinogen decarboxylase [Rhizomicrobium sp.]|jgi:uroporphyrinogen decarboxylase|nr:uroporphyrinogen decarboxylase [Rhizomicrobium sp.]